MQLTDEEFAQVVEEAIASVPEGFHRYLQEIAVDIEDSPDDVTCRELRIRDSRQLLGLYKGTPITRRHVEDSFRYPERIVIYQSNILRICRSRRHIIEQIHKTVLHEIGHHFGLNERQLRELGYG
jgi:predicted Zn-dependent protease with MMP-like domain